MAQRKVLKETPAVKYYEPQTTLLKRPEGDTDGMGTHSSEPCIIDGEHFAVFLDGATVGHFQAGSAIGFALKHASCPFEAIKTSHDRGEPLYWAFGLASMLTSHKQAQKAMSGFEMGQEFIFHGKRFTIEPDANRNIRFVEVK